MTTYTIDELEARFSEWLNDTVKPFVFFDREFPASKVLKEVDPVSWKEEFLNWMSEEEVHELYDPNSPDVQLYAYRSEIEEEHENSKLSALELAEQYEEQRGDEQYDWYNDTF